MLFQLHHQYRDRSKTDFVSQFEIPDDADSEQCQAALRDAFARIRDSHPLPEGAMWMVCGERAPQFVCAAK